MFAIPGIQRARKWDIAYQRNNMMSTLLRAQKTVPHHPLPWIVITTTGESEDGDDDRKEGFSPDDPWQVDPTTQAWMSAEPQQGYDREPIRSYSSGDDDGDCVLQAVLSSCHPEEFLPEIPHLLQPKMKSASLDEFPFKKILAESGGKTESEPHDRTMIPPSVEDDASNRQTKGRPGHAVTHDTPMPVGCGAEWKKDGSNFSYQLNVGVYNLGNLGRGAIPPGANDEDRTWWKKRKTEQVGIPAVPYIDAIFKGCSHVVLLCEAAEMLKSPIMRKAVKDNDFKAMFSRCGNLAVIAKAEKVSLVVDMTMKSNMQSVKYDHHDHTGHLPYPKRSVFDPSKKTPEHYGKRWNLEQDQTEYGKAALWYMIVDVKYGESSDGVTITRCGQRVTRVCVYHVDHKKASKSAYIVRDELTRMFVVCMYYQVDFIGGDANATSYKYFNEQTTKNYKMGSMMMTCDRVRQAYNEWLAEQKKGKRRHPTSTSID